ncbi:hypothetical protein COBT_002018 [Conglomerata obtusa]
MSLDITFSTNIRRHRKKEYFDLQNIKTDVYLISFFLPCNFDKFKDFESNFIRNKKFFDQKCNVDKEKDNTFIYDFEKHDIFIRSINVHYDLISNKICEQNFSLEEHIQACLTKTTIIKQPEINLNYVRFSNREICAINWLIDYFSIDYYYNTVFIFSDQVSIVIGDDMKLILRLRFDFTFPLLDNKFLKHRNDFFDCFEEVFAGFQKDIFNFLHYLNTTDKYENEFKKRISGYSIEKQRSCIKYFKACIKYIKIVISEFSHFDSNIEDYGMEKFKQKRKWTSCINYDLLSTYAKYFNFSFVIDLYEKKIYNVYSCLFSVKEISINDLKNKNCKQKKYCKQMLRLFAQLYAVVNYDYLLILYKYVFFKIKIYKSIVLQKHLQIDTFYNRYFFKLISDFKRDQMDLNNTIHRLSATECFNNYEDGIDTKAKYFLKLEKEFNYKMSKLHNELRLNDRQEKQFISLTTELSFKIKRIMNNRAKQFLMTHILRYNNKHAQIFENNDKLCDISENNIQDLNNASIDENTIYCKTALIAISEKQHLNCYRHKLIYGIKLLIEELNVNSEIIAQME